MNIQFKSLFFSLCKILGFCELIGGYVISNIFFSISLTPSLSSFAICVTGPKLIVFQLLNKLCSYCYLYQFNSSAHN